MELQKYLLGIADIEATLEKYDMNKDNAVDIFDLVLLRKELIKKS